MAIVYNNTQSIRAYKAESMQAARDLGYKRSTIAAIKSATTIAQIDRIMCNARHNDEFGAVDYHF